MYIFFSFYRISYLRDLVKKVHFLQQGSNAKTNPKNLHRTKAKEYALNATLRKNGSFQDLKMIDDDDDDHSDVDMDDFIIQWSTIKKCASEQQMARSWAEADNKLMQIENYLTYIVTKLESIDQTISNMQQGTTII